MSLYFYPIVYIFVIVFGVGLEALLSTLYFKKHGVKNKHQIIHFKFFRYLLLLSIPLITTFLMAYIVSLSILLYFLFFAVVGTLLEYCVGYAYFIIVGQRLWTYNRFSLNHHTSLLSIPLWGLCGALIYLLARTVS